MSLLLSPADLQHRVALTATGDMAVLAASLAADLASLLDREPEIPTAKAWLSRGGGRCARDGAMLAFDPFAPHEHRCPRCGEVYRGELHDRWWATWRQLWLAERAVHAALLALVPGPDAARHAALADSLLARYADGYARYPNQDNALGPTRPFFSTYLESIWLLQLCIALALREAGGAPDTLGAAVRDQLVAPSARLVAGFDEGGSNRQVWHVAALLAAGRLLGDATLVERAAFGPSGLVRQLGDGLLADGSWYEGENYHLFAHRGLWYGVQLCEAAGIELPPPLLARFAEGFATPFVTALPDLTFPARRDSQYAVSLRQWRFAELAELGLARGDDPRLTAALADLYAADAPRGDPGRWRSTAEAERNEPPSRLTRADLNWRALLFARPSLDQLAAARPTSALLDGQGLAVFRRDGGRLYAALDYGHSGGGHGHPDRLNVLIAHAGARWLDDMGTGSYVDASLHWYRSTLAHNAPLVNGHSQARVHGVLRAHEERPAAGWVDARVENAAPGVTLDRALVLLDGYLVSELAWTGPEGTQLDLPVHVDGEIPGVNAWEAADPAPVGTIDREDGWPFVAAASRATGAPFAQPLRVEAVRADGTAATFWLLAPADAELWRLTAPGAPGAGARRFYMVRVVGEAGRIVLAASWAGAVAGVAPCDGGVAVVLGDTTRHEHRRTGDGWQIALYAAGARSSIDLGGRRPNAATPTAPATSAAPRTAARLPLRRTLGEPHYRRSELTWTEAGQPTAVVSAARDAAGLAITVDVTKAALAFPPPRAENPLDNEHPDTEGDGVQLYLGLGDGRVAGWILIPEPASGRVRVSRAGQATADLALDATFSLAPAGGYSLRCLISQAALAAAGAPVTSLDVVVNDGAPGRQRRRGQLVLSGGAGEFVYLRGDRQPAERFVLLAPDDV